MSEPCLLRILVEDSPVYEGRLDGPLELGRQRTGEPEPYRLLPAAADHSARLIIAPQHARENLARRHLTLTPLPDGRVHVRNHSQAPLDREDPGADALPPDGEAELAPPFAFALPSCVVQVVAAGSADEHGIHTLEEPTRGPGMASDLSLSAHSLALLHPAQLRALLEGVPRALGVLQSAVGSADFLERASQALVQIVGLDTGRVLLRRGDAWEVAAAQGGDAGPGWRPSRHVIDRLLRDRAAVWQKPRSAGEPDSASLVLLDTVVAAPLLDRDNEVIGALYGECRRDSTPARRSDNRVEALLVNLLACSVATGLARLEQEQAALKATNLFEQFFTPELARHLAADPGLLEGREAQVTLLFADVRSFSRHCEQLGAAEAFRWVNDVMQE